MVTKKEKEKKGRKKIFPGGSTSVKINNDIYRIVEKESEENHLYPSQIVDSILRMHYRKKLTG